MLLDQQIWSVLLQASICFAREWILSFKLWDLGWLFHFKYKNLYFESSTWNSVSDNYVGNHNSNPDARCWLCELTEDVERIWIYCVVELTGFANGLDMAMGEWTQVWPEVLGLKNWEKELALTKMGKTMAGPYLGRKWDKLSISVINISYLTCLLVRWRCWVWVSLSHFLEQPPLAHF